MNLPFCLLFTYIVPKYCTKYWGVDLDRREHGSDSVLCGQFGSKEALLNNSKRQRVTTGKYKSSLQGTTAFQYCIKYYLPLAVPPPPYRTLPLSNIDFPLQRTRLVVRAAGRRA